MGKTNAATSTKAKAKESPKGKVATKPDRKADKAVKVVKVEKAAKADKSAKLDKKADKKVEQKVDKKVEQKVDKKSDQKVDKKTVKPAASASRTSTPVPVKAVAAKPAAPEVTYKCPFPPDELLKWRQILMAKRHEVTDDIAGLVKDAMDAEDGHTTPNHIAERGSDADLQDLSLGVAGEEKDVVWQIDRALRKIDANRPIPFGLCEQTKVPIPRTRLQLIPWTPLSIEGATHMEQNNLMLEDLLIED